MNSIWNKLISNKNEIEPVGGALRMLLLFNRLLEDFV